MKNLFLLFTVICTLSCASSKSSRKDIVYGSKCEITSITKTDSEKPLFVCFVYDRNEFNEPLLHAVVQYDSKSGKVTDVEGRIELEIPAGKHKIQVQYVGFESIERYIDFEPYTRTEMRVELGAQDNSMGLPKDLYEKPWKYPGAVY